MPTAQVKVPLSTTRVLEAVESMSTIELEQIFSRVIALRAQRKAPHLPAKESELLIKINRGLPPDIQKRLNQLVAKRRDGALTPDEHRELLELTNVLENAEANRVEALAELSRLRGVSLNTLMHELGIKPPDYV